MTEDDALWERDYNALEERLMAFDWNYAEADDPHVFNAGMTEQNHLFEEAMRLGSGAIDLYFEVLKAHS